MFFYDYKSTTCPRHGFAKLKDSRIWETKLYKGVYFNDFIKSNLANDILKRAIMHGMSGSSTDDKINFRDQEPTNYRLMNVDRDLQDAIADKSMAFDLDLVADDPENFVSDFVDEVSYAFDEFLGFEKQIHKFDEELKIFEKEAKDSFYFSVLYAIYYYLLEKKEDFDFCQDKKRLCKVLGQTF